MAAGQGFKTFVTGEVLTAGDVNGYLMQGINVFANATARDAAITAPAEGQFAFTKDNNSLWYYDGAAWVASGATGDIEGVTAGVGISGGGTSGTVTITNSMATAIDAKGDLVAGTAADTFSRLAVGSNGTVLTADSAEATGLKWASAAPSYQGCLIYKSAGQTLNSGSNTLQTFDLESFDTDAFHSTSTNTSRITIPTGLDGKYVLVGHSGLGNAVQDFSGYWVSITKNGSNIGMNNAVMLKSGMSNRNGVVVVADLVAGDYIELYVYYNDSGGGQETPSGISGTFLSASKL